ncbi:hypothetical protein ACIPJG_29235 [Streptomyces halstedii]|uniref:hypothetical protein n=1 Tax=Streptomyces TaxID=1883 RepID=UPI00056090B9|nr:hypothetical protein [Streptomyces griseolus]
MAKRGNGLGGTPVEIPRTGRANTWGVRTPLHFNKVTGKRERYWIGREYKNKTAAERALRVWITDYEAGKVAARSDMKLGDWLDKWLSNHRKEGTTMAGYETKVRLHIKPHIGGVKLYEVTDDTLDDLYRLLETTPCPTNKGKPLGGQVGAPRAQHPVRRVGGGGAQADTRQPRRDGSPSHRPADPGAGVEVSDAGRRSDDPVPGDGVGAVRQPGL